VSVNFLMSLFVLRGSTSRFWGGALGRTSLVSGDGVWSVAVALALRSWAHSRQPSAAPSLRTSMDAGANARCCRLSRCQPGRVRCGRAMLPAFAMVREWVLSVGGGLLVSLAVATNVLAALTGSASVG